jgi:hypothetical protein
MNKQQTTTTSTYPTPAQCKNMWKPHPSLPDTLTDLTSAPERFQTLQGDIGAK